MWAKAAEVFDSMLSSGCRPDAVTFSVLIAAYERGGQWRRCLQAFEKMQQQGFRPDACVYNVVSGSGGWLGWTGLGRGWGWGEPGRLLKRLPGRLPVLKRPQPLCS